MELSGEITELAHRLPRVPNHLPAFSAGTCHIAFLLGALTLCEEHGKDARAQSLFGFSRRPKSHPVLELSVMCRHEAQVSLSLGTIA